ncbi:hypothetical protein LFZ20_06210 [Salmonella enterica subsp. enterica serovar Johannesburg str. SA20025782]|nr:hypothetical protein LFZ20_06210 [Salmonella enterica subsp. enterica serovar Johannesburg str. SA20025782]
MAFGFTQKQFRMRDGATNIPQPNLFAVQSIVVRQRFAQYDRQLSIIRIVDNFQICFYVPPLQAGFSPCKREPGRD